MLNHPQSKENRKTKLFYETSIKYLKKKNKKIPI